MQKKIYINARNIKLNKKHAVQLPVIVCDVEGEQHLADELEICDADGRVLARVVYDPNNPQGGWATAWVETDCTIKLKNCSTARQL